MMYNLLATVAACAIFICCAQNGTTINEKLTDTGDIAFCLKQCQTTDTCSCKAAGKKDIKFSRFCDKDPGQKMGYCSYCVKFWFNCQKPSNRKFFCCDEIGRGYKKFENQSVECRENSGGNYQCLEPCNPATRKYSCRDKDGYATSKNYFNCTGPYKYSYVKCDGSACSTVGGVCGDGKHVCCTDDFSCANGKCKRKCTDIGSSCTNDERLCCTRFGTRPRKATYEDDVCVYAFAK